MSKPESTPRARDQAVRHLPVDLIAPGRFQARQSFESERLDELTASIRESGVVQPVVVRSTETGYELLAGERRWRASQRAGLHDIPAIIRDDLSDDEAMVVGLIENLQRESLSPMEAASGLAFLTEHYALTHEQTAARIGKSRVYVSNFLRLLKLADPVQDLVNQRQLSMGHARALAGLPVGQQPALARAAVSSGWSVRQLEARCRQLAKGDAVPAKPSTSSDWARAERQLTEQLGNRVSIDFDGRRGTVHIAFHSLDEFEGLIARFGCSLDDDTR